MEPSVAAHWIGIAGEGFNLAGAVVCALDLLMRRRDRKVIQNAAVLAELVRRKSIKNSRYRGLDPADPEFLHKLEARWPTRLGIVGVILFTVGFSLLVVYHWIEIQVMGPSHG